MKHLIGTKELSRPDIERLFAEARSLEGRRTDDLKGRILASLFFEPSTRTRLSFESAMYRLGGHVITAENAREFSSAAKGETIEDTTRIVSAYADAIVMRHPEAGAAARAAAVSPVPILNAGDGAGEHPSQSLLDLFTIERELGHIDGINVAFVGDLKNGRTTRSLARALTLFSDVHMTFVSPQGLAMSSDVLADLDAKGVRYDITESLDDSLCNADVIYQTRIQKERFDDPSEYERYRGVYVIDGHMAESMKEGSIIMHPLPRVDEITPDVDASRHARYFEQARHGLTVRMAILKTYLGGA